MNAERLFRDYNIPHVTEGHKHSTTGWVNVHCPFCPGSQNYHLGIHEELTGCHCWRCGSHPVVGALSKLLNLPELEIRKILRKYKAGGTATKKSITQPKVSIHPFKFPKPNSPLTKLGKKYLARRGFDPDYLAEEWGLLQTGPVSFLDGISYNHRILIPIHWNGKIVSFQGRDITDKSDRKYLACPMRREEIHHKNILYGKQEEWQKAKGIIVVEGPVDVWRFGPCAAGVLGTSFKMEQVLQLAKHHNRFFIMFDNEPQAQAQARLLAVKLKALGKEARIEKVKDDPGSMTQAEANHLVRELVN